jgi:ferredoxin-2, mitochondrial
MRLTKNLLNKFVRINFVNSKNELISSIDAPAGATLLEAALKAKVEVEGACGGQCACATCHMILPEKIYNGLKSPKNDELDMLDLAMNIEPYSRLGCQVKINEEMDEQAIKLPF